MVEVVNSQSGSGEPPADVLARAAELTLEREAAGRQWDVTVQLVSPQEMRDLNRRFGGQDAVTDVLSFNHTEGWKDGALESGAAAAMGTEEGYLGDIALCVEKARQQAEERGREPLREMALLTVHGTLHLLGYDHAETEERRVMFAKTDAILDELFAETEAAPQGGNSN